MYDIKKLRDHFGFSQAQLAVYLSISTSLLKMIESGKRNIPSPVALKLAWMEQVKMGVYSGDAFDNKRAEANARQQLKKLRLSIAEIAVQIQRNEKELLLMQLRHQQAVRRAILLQYLRSKAGPEAAAEADGLWLSVQWTATNKALNRYNPTVQALLQWKIISLLYSKEKAEVTEQILQRKLSGHLSANVLELSRVV